VFFALAPDQAVLSDSNPRLIKFYRVLRDEWKAVSQKLKEHQIRHLENPDSYYYQMREMRPRSEASFAARFIYLNRTCFNGIYRVNLKGKFNVPRGTKNTVVFEDDDFESISQLLKKTKLRAGDFSALIRRCGAGDFLFIDPPYTVKHNINGFIKYNEKLFSWADQERLAASLKNFANRGGRAIITNAAHASVIQLYRDLGSLALATRHSVMASSNDRRASIDELIVLVNIPEQLAASVEQRKQFRLIEPNEFDSVAKAQIGLSAHL